jgi:hypothetical protein
MINNGHYTCVSKWGDQWIHFDDDKIDHVTTDVLEWMKDKCLNKDMVTAAYSLTSSYQSSVPSFLSLSDEELYDKLKREMIEFGNTKYGKMLDERWTETSSFVPGYGSVLMNIFRKETQEKNQKKKRKVDLTIKNFHNHSVFSNNEKGEETIINQASYSLSESVAKSIFTSLKDEAWLLDECLNMILNILRFETKLKHGAGNLLLPTFFAKHLLYYQYSFVNGMQVKKQMSEKQLRQAKEHAFGRCSALVENYKRMKSDDKYVTWIIPVGIDGHWFLMVVDWESKNLTIHDSCRKNYDDVLDIVISFLEQHECNGGDVWHRKYNECHPLQTDAYNCGIFTIISAILVHEKVTITYEPVICGPVRTALHHAFDLRLKDEIYDDTQLIESVRCIVIAILKSEGNKSAFLNYLQ